METPTASTSLNIQQDHETISQQGIFHFTVHNEFSLLVKLENRGEKWPLLVVSCCHLWKNQT